MKVIQLLALLALHVPTYKPSFISGFCSNINVLTPNLINDCSLEVGGTLNASERNIDVVDETACSLMDKYNVIRLDSNKLRSLPKNCLFKNATSVDLSNNRLQQLSDQLPKNRHLGYLNVAGNPIKTLDFRLNSNRHLNIFFESEYKNRAQIGLTLRIDASVANVKLRPSQVFDLVYFGTSFENISCGNNIAMENEVHKLQFECSCSILDSLDFKINEECGITVRNGYLLADNKGLSEISENLCIDLNGYSDIYLRNNQLVKLPDSCVFHHASHIDLSFNRLRVVNRLIFTNGNLQVLNLTGNDIISIDLRRVPRTAHVEVYLGESYISGYIVGGVKLILGPRLPHLLVSRKKLINIVYYGFVYANVTCGSELNSTHSQRYLQVNCRCPETIFFKKGSGLY